MYHHRNLSIDRQFERIRLRDKLIRDLLILSALLIAIIVIMAVMLLIATQAQATECQVRPDANGSWTWRYVEPHEHTRCWYRGRHVLSKSQLHWANKPKPEDLTPRPAPPNRADANGNAMKANAMANDIDEIQYREEAEHRLQACCWPPINQFEQDFEAMWKDLPPQWRAKQ